MTTMNNNNNNNNNINMAKIIEAGTEIGLSLNVSKCELIAHKDFQVNDALLQSFASVH